MDVRIGEITADVDVAGDSGTDDATTMRIARKVMALIDARNRTERRAQADRAITSPDSGDLERYG